MDIYQFVGILGLVIISLGVFWQKKYLEDLLYVLGGVSLFLYSYHIDDLIFIAFSVLFVMAAFAHLIRTIKYRKLDKLDKLNKANEVNEADKIEDTIENN